MRCSHECEVNDMENMSQPIPQLNLQCSRQVVVAEFDGIAGHGSIEGMVRALQDFSHHLPKLMGTYLKKRHRTSANFLVRTNYFSYFPSAVNAMDCFYKK